MQENLIDLSSVTEPSNDVVIEIEKLQSNNIRELIYNMNRELNLTFDDINTVNIKKSKLDIMEANINKSIENICNTEYSDDNIKKELYEGLTKLQSKIKLLNGDFKKGLSTIQELKNENNCICSVLFISAAATMFLFVIAFMALSAIINS